MDIEQKLAVVKGVLDDQSAYDAVAGAVRFFSVWSQLVGDGQSPTPEEANAAFLTYVLDLPKNPAWATLGLAVISSMAKTFALWSKTGGDLPALMLREMAMVFTIVGQPNKITDMAEAVKGW